MGSHANYLAAIQQSYGQQFPGVGSAWLPGTWSGQQVRRACARPSLSIWLDQPHAISRGLLLGAKCPTRVQGQSPRASGGALPGASYLSYGNGTHGPHSGSAREPVETPDQGRAGHGLPQAAERCGTLPVSTAVCKRACCVNARANWFLWFKGRAGLLPAVVVKPQLVMQGKGSCDAGPQRWYAGPGLTILVGLPTGSTITSTCLWA